MTANASCPNTPTPRSETARLRHNFFNVAGIDEAFHRAWIERRFPRIARKENNKFRTQNAITKGSLNWTSFEFASNFRVQNGPTMANRRWYSNSRQLWLVQLRKFSGGAAKLESKTKGCSSKNKCNKDSYSLARARAIYLFLGSIVWSSIYFSHENLYSLRDLHYKAFNVVPLICLFALFTSLSWDFHHKI